MTSSGLRSFVYVYTVGASVVGVTSFSVITFSSGKRSRAPRVGAWHWALHTIGSNHFTLCAGDVWFMRESV